MVKARFKLLFFITTLLVLTFVLFVSNLAKVNAVMLDNVNLSCKSYVLLDYESGKVLSSYNEDKKFPVASICKLMTSLITLENIESGNLSWDEEIVVSEHAASMEGSQAFLDANNKYKLDDIFKSVVVASANDSAVVLAERIAGSESEFVKLMNEKAKQLNMNNTKYDNATGLPTLNQHSTAKDTSIILKEISKYDKFNEYCNIWMDKLVHPSGRETDLVNTNRLIKYYDGCLNGKTGFTNEAGYCLASSAKRGDMHLISVVLGCNNASDRFVESKQLYDYGFNNFVKTNIVNQNDILGTINIDGGKDKTINIVAKEGFSDICKKTETGEIITELEVQKSVKAPYSKNDSVGKLIVSKNGNILKEIDVVLERDALKQTYKNIVEKIIKNW